MHFVTIGALTAAFLGTRPIRALLFLLVATLLVLLARMSLRTRRLDAPHALHLLFLGWMLPVALVGLDRLPLLGRSGHPTVPLPAVAAWNAAVPVSAAALLVQDSP